MDFPFFRHEDVKKYMFCVRRAVGMGVVLHCSSLISLSLLRFSCPDSLKVVRLRLGPVTSAVTDDQFCAASDGLSATIFVTVDATLCACRCGGRGSELHGSLGAGLGSAIRVGS